MIRKKELTVFEKPDPPHVRRCCALSLRSQVHTSRDLSSHLSQNPSLRQLGHSFSARRLSPGSPPRRAALLSGTRRRVKSTQIDCLASLGETVS